MIASKPDMLRAIISVMLSQVRGGSMTPRRSHCHHFGPQKRIIAVGCAFLIVPCPLSKVVCVLRHQHTMVLSKNSACLGEVESYRGHGGAATEYGERSDEQGYGQASASTAIQESLLISAGAFQYAPKAVLANR